MIKAVGKKGGLVMVNFGCEFLSQKSADTSAWTNPAIAEKLQQRFASISDPRERRSAYRKALEESDLKMTRATIDDVVAHIDHIRSIAGIGAVGIGTDFDGISCTPEGLDDVSKFPNLTRKLLEKGYNPQDIRKIYGANLLRFMRAVEDAAEKPAR
jgi:membrane dipeptidase